MPNALPPLSPHLAGLIDAHRPGHALAQAFYTDDDVFTQDMEAMFLNQWHLAGHVSEVPEPGDYILFEMLSESVILCRDEAGAVRGFANVCRHRGSRLCTEARGHVKRFTCPYHAWAYGLDGALFSARFLEEDVDRTALGLRPVAVKVFHGLIYVSFSDQPTGFDLLHRDLDAVVAPFGLERTRIAHRAQYPVQANWKLLVENYNECYHCTAAHPEFSRSHVIHMPPDRAAPLSAALGARSQDCGLVPGFVDCIGQNRPAGAPDYAYNRYALFDGYQTGSEDGAPLAPLLGSLGGYDGGASDLYVGLLNPMLIYCDHAVIYRFVPVDKDRSVQEIIWLVHEDAVAGHDYDLARLTWLWDVTTEADKRIIEMNQQGINSRYYVPGPFVSRMEGYTQRFVETYLDSLRG